MAKKLILPLEAAPSWLIKAAASELTFWRQTKKVDGLAIASIGTTISRANHWDISEVKSVLGQVSHIDVKLVETMATAADAKKVLFPPKPKVLFPPKPAEQLKLF